MCDPLSILPPELCVEILVLLDDRTLMAAAQVSRRWHAAVSDNYLWLMVMKRTYPSCGPALVAAMKARDLEVDWRSEYEKATLTQLDLLSREFKGLVLDEEIVGLVPDMAAHAKAKSTYRGKYAKRKAQLAASRSSRPSAPSPAASASSASASASSASASAGASGAVTRRPFKLFALPPLVEPRHDPPWAHDPPRPGASTSTGASAGAGAGDDGRRKLAAGWWSAERVRDPSRRSRTQLEIQYRRLLAQVRSGVSTKWAHWPDTPAQLSDEELESAIGELDAALGPRFF